MGRARKNLQGHLQEEKEKIEKTNCFLNAMRRRNVIYTRKYFPYACGYVTKSHGTDIWTFPNHSSILSDLYVPLPLSRPLYICTPSTLYCPYSYQYVHEEFVILPSF